jgi:hypothetical protein
VRRAGERSALVGQNAIVLEYRKWAINPLRRVDLAHHGIVHIVVDNRVVFLAQIYKTPGAVFFFLSRKCQRFLLPK